MPFEPQPFGKYTLVEKLAVGGMAMIYRAKIEGVKGFQKDLVIKQILPQYSDMPDFIDMFIDEAKIAVNLNHANIVPVYELGEIDGALYIAMEYVHGRDTGQILEVCEERGREIPPHIAAYLLTQVCRALDYAHNKRDEATRKPLKIIHRDVSPNNVIVSFDGDVKIIDFGIAKATIKVSVTQFGTLKGKMIYMSPEQASERPLDHRSDIFSAGILLYELLTGQRPYGGDNFAVLQENVKTATFNPPNAIDPTLPPALVQIVLKAMARDPNERFQTAFEMERALSQYLVGSGNQVFDRDVAQFMRDLFGDPDTASRPDPTPVSSADNLLDNTNPQRAAATTPGVIPPEVTAEQTPVSGARDIVEETIPRRPVDEPTATPFASTPIDPTIEDSTRKPGADPLQDDTVIGTVPQTPGSGSTPTRPLPQSPSDVAASPSWDELPNPPAPPPPPPGNGGMVRAPTAGQQERIDVGGPPSRVPQRPPRADPPRTRPSAAVPEEKAPWEEGDAEEEKPKRKGIGGFFDRIIGRGKDRDDAVAKGSTDDDVLMGTYDSPQDFLENGYANHGGSRGMFLTTRSVNDVPLGVDLPIELVFGDPAARFRVHGQVIWRRAKDGHSKGKRLPAGLAIEFVTDKDDDYVALFQYLGAK